ncbi:MAG: class I SAM-dependent RNA methyltransferase [Nitrospirae bacterium]|nr:class I SAM-dependent RNA methyltransferase [Nitrospirota bacterium]MCL5977621.1 class I SAM-dependent RNA methyltransferase [Nitrospirota bacterium]
MAVVTLKAESPAYGGLSIGRWKGKIVFIKGVVPGETIEAEIEEEKKDYYKASAVKIAEYSPDRIKPLCRYFGACGGCQLQYISYQRQIRLKEEILKDCLKRLAKIEINLSESLAGNPYNYRHRGQFKVSRGGIGFYREKTREVIDIESCPLMINEINELLAKTKKFLKGERLFSEIKEIHISYGDEATALIKAKDRRLSAWNDFAAAMIGSGFSGVFMDFGDNKPLKQGKEFITLNLDSQKYTLSPMSFLQSNWRLNLDVVRLLKDCLQPLRGKRVLDMYAGAGNFSLPVSLDAGEVIAVEENPYAVEDGKRNVRINAIKNCRFIRSSIEAVNVKGRVDILITDPPRAGLTNRAVEKIISMTPERIAYVSCNPTTLARDLKKLLVKYDIESLRVIDFFPQTYHIEALAFLGLK